MGKYIQQSDLENARGVQFIVGCFDDNGDGVADAAPVAAVITRAEGMVDAFLKTQVTLPIPASADRLIVEACIEYAMSFTCDRRPEYARRFGGDANDMSKGHYGRARTLCLDIKSAQIELPDNQDLEPAGNTGAIIHDCSKRMIVESAGGGYNGGDF